MKILIVNGVFLPYLNGPAVYINNLAEEFIRRGHEVTIVAGGPKEESVKFGDINLIRYKKPDSNISLGKGYRLYRERSDRKIREIDYDKFDLVITRGDIFLPELKAIFDSDKIIYISPGLRDIDDNIFDAKVIAQRKKEIASDIEKIKIVVFSKFLKNSYDKYFGRTKDIWIIPPGIDLDKYDLSKMRKNEILFVGRISPEKNINSMVSAFEKIKKGKLVIVGGGLKLDCLKNDIKKSPRIKDINIVGESEEPTKYYERAKIFVLPSRQEAFGIVLLEAMASGLPCIAFKPDGKNIMTASDEIIKEGITGFLVKNEKEMAEKINLLLSDKKLLKRMSVNTRRAAEKYSWKKAADDILELV